MFWFIALVAATAMVFACSKRKGSWPDGPLGLPFLGTIPAKGNKLHQHFAKYASIYGDFFSIRLGRRNMIILSSPQAVEDLIVKKGGVYASRPPSFGPAAVIGQSRLVTMQYGNEFRRVRKSVHSLLGIQNAKTFLPYQEYESRQTLKRILIEPDSFFTEVARYSTSVTFSLLIGARVASSKSLVIEAYTGVFKDTFTKLRPGYWLVDWIPALDYLPDSLAPWRKEAQRTFEDMTTFWSVFYDSIHQRTKTGTAPDCFMKRFFESPEYGQFTDAERKVLMSTLLSGGSETTSTVLQWFFKAMVMNPHVVKTAQEELDGVVGSGRMPTWEDQPSLPYIGAIMDETQRWASVAPLAIFHAASEDDTYRGRIIPYNTPVIYNTHSIHHNPEYYQDPDAFVPERFLPEKDSRYRPGLAYAPTSFAFGVGRRECPGKHVADSSLFIEISRLLWSFNITLGANTPPSDETTGGFPVLWTVPFRCSITPRSEKIAEIIRIEADKHDPALSVEDTSIYDEAIKKALAQKTAKPAV